MTAMARQRLQVDGMQLAYCELGNGPPVLMLHGWPMSSFLWRAVMVPVAKANRVIALDLPGFGASDKPVGIRYSFEFFTRVLDVFLAQLGIDRLGLAVHDLGGPVGLHWTLQRPGRVTKLALLNTLVYPEFSEAVKEFVRACTTPGLRERITSAAGPESIMRDGAADPAKLRSDVLAAIQEPFQTAEARRALADAGMGLSMRGFAQIARQLPTLRIPVRVVYGVDDRVLPDVAQTMARVKTDLPHAEVSALQHCGHFLQEDKPEEVGALLARFFAE
jgi:pimeloyl-ACP methyl ester carboxylesterase